MIDPNGARLYYSVPTDPSGGKLDRDDNVNKCGIDTEPGGVENSIWPSLDLKGVYTVELHAYRGCSAGTPTPYTIQVWVDSILVDTRTGTSDLSANCIRGYVHVHRHLRGEDVAPPGRRPILTYNEVHNGKGPSRRLSVARVLHVSSVPHPS